MRRRERQSDEAPGQDSFLDVVANLVGILIILVMIVGARAKDAMLRADQPPKQESTQTVDLRAAKVALASAQRDVQDLLGKMNQQQFEIKYRRSERNRILTLIKTAEITLEQRRSLLDDESRQAHQARTEALQAEQELKNLKMTLEAVQHSAPPVTVIAHRPTPMAKTVFGKEIHFRMSGGRIVFVPLDELVEKFQTHARLKAWKLRQSPRITETVGPIGGFRLQYTLKKATQKVDTRGGTIVQERVQLDHFVLLPVSDQLGEPFDGALNANSQFRSILSSYDPNGVTVTIWVYPDSYDQFRRIKEELYKFGFLTAGRPMPDGQPISGSPNGIRSAVQ